MKQIHFSLRSILYALIFAVAMPSVNSQAAETTLPKELTNASSLEEARNKLFDLRDSGQVSQQEMMQLAKDPDMERRLRSQPLDEIMEGMKYKDTGSPPAKSRGAMSDIDRTLGSLDDYNSVVERARKMGLTIEETDYRVKIKELDTVVWKPAGRDMALVDRRTSLAERATILGDDPEVAYEAGRKRGAHAYMSVSENLTKGQNAFFGDLDGLSRSHAELEIVAGAKDVWRSLQAAGMCTGEMAAACAELEKIKSMEVSPGDLLERQKNLRELMGKAREKSMMLLDMEADSLAQRMRDAVDPDEIRYLDGRFKELRGQMTESVERMRILSERYPSRFSELTGGKSFAQFRDDMIRRGVKLEQSRTSKPIIDTSDADRVRKMSYIVDALQFAECIINGGTKTECFKQAVGGYLMGEAIGEGVYAISLVSSKGALVASGALTVVGFAATTYYTGVKLGEAFYEASEYLDARKREDEARATMADAQQARVKDLGAQLTKLEALAAKLVGEVEKRKKNMLAELEKHERLGQTMEEALPYRSQYGPRLDAMLLKMSKMADQCNETEGLLESVNRKSEQSTTHTEQVELKLKEAQAEAERCADKGAVQRGDALYQEALRLQEENHRIVKSLEEDRKTFKGIPSGSASIEDISEMREIVERLKELRDKARENLTDIVEMSKTVADINEYIGKGQDNFKVSTVAFRQAFPENLTSEWINKYGFPEEMARAWERRLQKAEQDVAGIQPMEDDVWRQQRSELMDRYPAIGADAKGFVSYVNRIAPQFERKSETLSACNGGGIQDRINQLKLKVLIENADTQMTLADLAVSKLGKGYSEKADICRSQVAGRTGTEVSTTGGKPKEKKPWVYSKFDRPVHLYRYKKETKDVSLMLARSVFEKDGYGMYMIPDGSGGVYHEDCELSGPYSDEAALCAVLRGYGKKSVAYIGGASFVECPKDGPTVQPTFISAGAAPTVSGPAAGGGTPQTRGGPLQIGPVKGSVQMVSSAGVAQPANSQSTLASGSGLQTGKDGEVSFQSPGGTSVTLGPSSAVRMSPPEADGKRRGVELLQGRVVVRHPEGTPDFDDVMIRSSDGSMVADGTRYRVEKEQNGTRVQVFEGSVRLTGDYIIRTYAPGIEGGKPSPVKEMKLKAGEQALLVGTSSMTQNVPSRLQPPSITMSDPGKPSTVPSPLAQPDPWNNTKVQQLIDQWIAQAIPSSNTPDVVMHYNEWLQPLSQAARSTAPPDHPADWTRYRYAWENRMRYSSANLCSLGEFLERSISGKGTTDCARAVASAPAPAKPAAPPAALQPPTVPLPKEPQRPAEKPKPLETPKPPATPPPGEKKRVDFTGSWKCIITNPADSRTSEAVQTIYRDNWGRYQLYLKAAEAQFQAKYVEDNRIGFVIGDGTTDKDIYLDFEMRNNNLEGTDRVVMRDGKTYTYDIRCTKIGASGGKK